MNPLNLIRRGYMIAFSIIILQLLYISMCATGDIYAPHSSIYEMLEYAAASCSVTFAGACIAECLFIGKH